MIHEFSIRRDRNESRIAVAFSDTIWTHKIDHVAPFDHYTPVHHWCEERFGPCGSLVLENKPFENVLLDTSRAWVNTGVKFCFKDPNDAFYFKMAWG